MKKKCLCCNGTKIQTLLTGEKIMCRACKGTGNLTPPSTAPRPMPPINPLPLDPYPPYRPWLPTPPYEWPYTTPYQPVIITCLPR